MTLYELINPSDKCTFRAPTHRVAAIVAVLLGEGHYAAEPISGDGERVPIFMFGGFEAWWATTFPGTDLTAAIAEDGEATEAALRTVAYGNRTDFDAACEAIPDADARDRFIANWNERKRTSMNNIVGRATSYANALADKRKVAA